MARRPANIEWHSSKYGMNGRKKKRTSTLVACEDRAQALSHLGHTHAMPLLRDPRDASIHDTCMFT